MRLKCDDFHEYIYIVPTFFLETTSTQKLHLHCIGLASSEGEAFGEKGRQVEHCIALHLLDQLHFYTVFWVG